MDELIIGMGYDLSLESDRKEMQQVNKELFEDRRRAFDSNYSKESIEKLVEVLESWKDDVRFIKHFYGYSKMSFEEQEMFDAIIRNRKLELLNDLEQRKSQIENYKDVMNSLEESNENNQTLSERLSSKL